MHAEDHVEEDMQPLVVYEQDEATCDEQIEARTFATNGRRSNLICLVINLNILAIDLMNWLTRLPPLLLLMGIAVNQTHVS